MPVAFPGLRILLNCDLMKYKKTITGDSSQFIGNADRKNHVLSYCIAAVWIANGLFSKVLNLTPRHEQIVARILGDDYSRALTVCIGLSEIAMAIWILSAIKTRLNSIVQIGVVAVMNILEFIFAPDLLLWGRVNSLFAFLFIIVIYYDEFHLNKNNSSK